MTISIPYIGSKRNYAKKTVELVGNGGYAKTIEPYGGSLVLSANIIQSHPNTEVVMNDFDNLFFEKYEEYLKIKESIIKKLSKIRGGGVTLKNH